MFTKSLINYFINLLVNENTLQKQNVKINMLNFTTTKL